MSSATRSTGEATSQERRDAHPERQAHPRQCRPLRRRARNDRRLRRHARTAPSTACWTVGSMISINLGAARTVGLVYAIGKADLYLGRRRAECHRGQRRTDRRSPRPRRPGASRSSTAASPSIRISAPSRTASAPRDLQAVYDLAGRPSGHHRHAVAGRDDRRPHRHRRHAGPPFRRRRHHRRRQVDRRVAAAAQGDRGAPRPAHPDPRSAQRIRRLAARILRARSTPTRSTCRSGCSGSRNSPRCCSAAARPCRKRSTLLRDLIPAAKNLYRNPAAGAFLRRGGDALTADTPVPYRMADLIKQIDERMGLLESKNDRPTLQVAEDAHRIRRQPIRATASCSIRG